MSAYFHFVQLNLTINYSDRIVIVGVTVVDAHVDVFSLQETRLQLSITKNGNGKESVPATHTHTASRD